MKKNKILLYVTLFALILNIFNPLIVYAESKGKIRNNPITVGDTKEAGNVKVTKTVTEVNNNGTYRIKFDVVGKSNTTISKKDAKPYIVYVLDRSGTMGAKLNVSDSNSNTRLWYSRRIAESSSKDFFEDGAYKNAMIAAITFAQDRDDDPSKDPIAVRREFANDDLNGTMWGSGAAGGYTPTDKAIAKAVEMLNAVTDATSKHIILLSDGVPEDGNGKKEIENKTKEQAKKAKDSGIEIFSVFLQDKYNYNADAKNLMDTIASTPATTHSFDASDSDALTKSFKNITTSIIETEVKAPAATNAVLNDIIGSDFTYVFASASSSDITVDGKNVTINIGDVNESEKSYYFDIQIDEDASTGWHKTNDSFNLTGNGLNNTVETDKSAEVYWEENYKKLGIEKVLEGISNDNIKFNFKITLKDKEGNLLSGEYKYKLTDGTETTDTETTLKFVNGVATIGLKDGEKVEFINIPRNTWFSIEETTRDGYKTQVCTNDNNCENKYKYANSLSDNINIKFVNTGSEYELPETGSSGGLILIITGLTFTGGAVIYILIDLLRKNRMC